MYTQDGHDGCSEDYWWIFVGHIGAVGVHVGIIVFRSIVVVLIGRHEYT